MMGREQCIKVLLAAGKASEVDGADNAGWTALFYASVHGHAGAVRELLRAGADRKRRDKLGQWTAGHHYASSAGQAEVLAALVEGPEGKEMAESFDNFGNSCLHQAASWGHAECLEARAGRKERKLCSPARIFVRTERQAGLTAVSVPRRCC